jgi:hypothetical protein
MKSTNDISETKSSLPSSKNECIVGGAPVACNRQAKRPPPQLSGNLHSGVVFGFTDGKCVDRRLSGCLTKSPVLQRKFLKLLVLAINQS